MRPKIQDLILNKNFVADFIKNKPYLYTTTITETYVDMAYNWFLSLKKINQDHLVLIGALGHNCFLKLKNLNIPAVLIDVEFSKNETKQDWIENTKNTKLILFEYLIQNFNIKFFASDVDVFINKNPYLYIEPFIDEDYHVFVMNDKRYDPFLPERKLNVQTLISKNKLTIDYCGPTAQQLYGEENAGFSFINVKEEYKTLYTSYLDKFYEIKENINQKGTESSSIQTLSNKIYKDINVKFKKLNCFDFVNGSIWKIPYLNKKIKDTYCMVHYNFCEPFDLEPIPLKEKKIEWMKENQHWLI
jgi:hypothetical protein